MPCLVLKAFVGEGAGLETNHKNHIKGDNRLENLEYTNKWENNSHAHSIREGRLPGARFDKETGRWRSELYFKGKTFNLGRFKTPEEANAAYKNKLKELGLENKYA